MTIFSNMKKIEQVSFLRGVIKSDGIVIKLDGLNDIFTHYSNFFTRIPIKIQLCIMQCHEETVLMIY